MEECCALTVSNRKCKRKQAIAYAPFCKFHHQMYSYVKPDDCPICTEPLPASLRPTKCGHYFHKQCLETWLKKSTSCPVCREIIKKQADTVDLSPYFHVSTQLYDLQSELDEETFQRVKQVLQQFIEFVNTLHQEN